MRDDPIDHEMRNVIAVGKAQAQIMQRKVERGDLDENDIGEGLKRIRTSFDRLAQLCHLQKRRQPE